MKKMAIAERRTEEEEEQNPKKTNITQQHQQQVDRISQLPDDILHHILSLLTLKESCVTSALSKRWRYLFPTLPRLDFDNFSFCSSMVRSCAQWVQHHDIGYDCWVWLELVSRILASRRAPVRICAIRSDSFDQYSDDFGSIIRFLCDGGVQELTIDSTDSGDHYTVPSCLYSCRTPTRIDLSKCILQVPSKFIGLRRLSALKLEECIVGSGALRRLISGCRAVESLTLHHCDRLRNLAVDAQKLAVLDVTTHRPLAVSIVNAPRLESVAVRFRYDQPQMYLTFLDPDDSNSDIDDGGGTDDEANDADESEASRLVRLLESLGSVQNLSLEYQNIYLKRLRTQRVALPVTLRSLLPKMKRLTLKMQLNNAFMVSIVSCLLNSCSKLEDLVIGDMDGFDYRCPEASVLGYWDQQMPSDCTRNTLSTVTTTAYLDDGCNWEYWIKLVKFLLNNACVLKTLVIYCYHREKSKVGDFKRELLQLQPASPDAVVELKTAGCHMASLDRQPQLSFVSHSDC